MGAFDAANIDRPNTTPFITTLPFRSFPWQSHHSSSNTDTYTAACGQSLSNSSTPSCIIPTGPATPRAHRHLRQLQHPPNNHHHTHPIPSKHDRGEVTSHTHSTVFFVPLSRCLVCRHGAPFRFQKYGHTAFNPLSFSLHLRSTFPRCQSVLGTVLRCSFQRGVFGQCLIPCGPSSGQAAGRNTY